MTQEQLKEAVKLNEQINELRKTLEGLSDYNNCRLSFIYDIKDGNGTHFEIEKLTKKIDRL